MNIKVTMHTGDEYFIDVEEYNAKEINDQRNDSAINAILIGDHSLSSINIRDVIPMREEEVEQPVEEVEQPVGDNEEIIPNN